MPTPAPLSPARMLRAKLGHPVDVPSLRGLLSRLSQRTAPAAPVSNGACPDCDRAVVVSGAEFRHFGPLGPMGAPRTDDELRLACPVHGRPPHNERSKLLGTASE